SPSLKLHSHFGPFQVLTAYTPVHSYPQTLTYRSRINANYWPGFFDKTIPDEGVYAPTDILVKPSAEDSLKAFQRMIEDSTDVYYLKALDIRRRSPHQTLPVYR